jgi:hypothetical protein
MPHQESLTIIDQIKPGQIEALKELLGTLAGHRDTWEVIPFTALSNVHFARILVLDEAKARSSDRPSSRRAHLEARVVPSRLVMLTDIDAPLDAHLRDLATTCGEGMDRVFGHCQGFPAPGARTADSRMAYLRRHAVPSRVSYVNRLGRSVQQIRQEAELRRAIDGHLDTRDFSGKSPMDVRAAIQEFVRSQPALHWATSPADPPALSWRIKEALHKTLPAAAAVLLGPIILVLLPIWLILLRRHEKSDVPDDVPARAEALRMYRADEDFGGQNQILAIGFFKPGMFRAITANAILGLADYAVRHIYNRGTLSGLNTIHFARWVPLDDNTRMFFSSNYDGSLESYMNDFIDKAAWGLNAIFSNGDGFPRTAYLFCGGITDEQAYKRFLPTRQVQSRVWYSAYKGLSTKNIANNAEIRAGLFARLDADQTEAWLRRFGAGNQLPTPGLVARFLNRIRWDRICHGSS